MSLNPPYLSIVATGRNDGYGGDFVGRFLRTLAFNARQLDARGVPWEFVFVEWAPPAGEPLVTDLALDALPGIDRVLRTFVVDPAYQDALTMNPRIRYLEFIAKNVGIRRSSGAFVLTTNADVYLSRHVLSALQSRALSTRTVYRARRIDLKLGIDESTMDWDVLEDGRNYDGGTKALKPPLYSGGTGDFVLLDAATFAELRGFNEVYRVAKIGIDRNFLVKALRSGVPILDIGGPVYHVNHVGSYRQSKALYRDRPSDAPYGDRRWPSATVVYDNPEHWGLAGAPAEESSTVMTRLQFDWSAIAPLVEHRRVLAGTGVSADEDGDDR
jgi:hypothetical protein